ncbi:hypothetical protein GF420_12320 [candidate division GN15 bacterium]|nr:hypothetical protein [candidate division GN15 bacterium]
MHHFSTLLKLSRAALAGNMLLMLAFVLVSAIGPDDRLVPWGLIGLAALIAIGATLTIITYIKMGRQKRSARKILRALGLLLTLALILLVAYATLNPLGVVICGSPLTWQTLLTPVIEVFAIIVTLVNLFALTTVGRA